MKITPPTDRDYTQLWTDQFNAAGVQSYLSKFHQRFEKNLKHRELVAFVKPFVKPDIRWLDCPIGAGRLFDEFDVLQERVGGDISQAFLDFNRSKGRSVLQCNLFSLPFENEFDLVTCTNTLFAFSNYKDALRQLWKGLKPGGHLIFDLQNAKHVEFARKFGIHYDCPGTVEPQSIHDFFAELGGQVVATQNHDVVDNLFLSKALDIGGRPASLSYRAVNLVYFAAGLAPALSKLSRFLPEEIAMKTLFAVKKS